MLYLVFSSYDQVVQLSFVEFLEALARISDMATVPTGKNRLCISTQLKLKARCVDFPPYGCLVLPRFAERDQTHAMLVAL